jgi:hypothetical protein
MVKREYDKYVVIPDAHCPYHDKKTYDTVLQFTKDQHPDHVVIIGDFVDMYSVSKYDKNPERAGRLQEELDSAHDALSQLREAVPKAKIHYLEGNHESVSRDTEVLTLHGWVRADELVKNMMVAQFAPDGAISFSEPSSLVQHYSSELIEFESYNMRQCVTLNHDVIVGGKKVPAKKLLGATLKESQFRLSGKGNNESSLSDDDLRLITWVVSDGTIVDYKKYDSESKKVRVQFKLSRPEKISRLKELLDEMEVPYTIAEATKSGVNKLQPYYIRIYGEDARRINAMLGGIKQFPSSFAFLSRHQLCVVMDTLQHTDGSEKPGGLSWTTTSSHDRDVIGIACLYNGMVFTYAEKEGGSGFSATCKTQYRCRVYSDGTLQDNNVAVRTIPYNDLAFCVTMPLGTIITRNNGKVAFTGNCRLQKYLWRHPEVHSLKNLRIPELLRLKDLRIDYANELLVNGVFLFTHGVRISKNSAQAELDSNGISGMSGHVHRVQTAMKTDYTGEKVWHCIGHIADATQAEYTAHPNWQQAVGIVYFDKHSKRFFSEVIPITESKLMYGGKVYKPRRGK